VPPSSIGASKKTTASSASVATALVINGADGVVEEMR
jgi:hypothetical protein